MGSPSSTTRPRTRIYAERALPAPGLKPASDSEAAALARRALSPQERVKRLLAGGSKRTVTSRSTAARRLVTTSGDVTYLVDPDTYIPIELRATRDGGEIDLRFRVYETLSPSVRGGGLFSLRAQHPDAAVKVDAEAYESLWGELRSAENLTRRPGDSPRRGPYPAVRNLKSSAQRSDSA